MVLEPMEYEENNDESKHKNDVSASSLEHKRRLEDIVDGIEDVSDPSAMDKVLIYLEELQEEDEEFMQLLTQRLQHETIYWEQPWYQKTYRLSRKFRMTNDACSDTFRTDLFSSEEADIVVKNWRKFRKKFKLPDTLICLARWKNKGKSRNPKFCPVERARRFLTAYLARGLQRNNYQVYRFILSYYGNLVKGYFSPIEEKVINICYHNKPRLVGRILSVVLGREPRGVYQRLRAMCEGKPENKRLKWTLPLASKFLNLLMKHSGLELEELKNKVIDTHVWHKLENEMDHRSPYLQHFWYCYLHIQLFVRCDVKLNRLLKKLFKSLKNSSYRFWSDIRWKKVALNYPDGFTSRFLYRICNRIVTKRKKYLKIPLGELMDFALDKIKELHRSRGNKRLKRLILNKDGQLELAPQTVNIDKNLNE